MSEILQRHRPVVMGRRGMVSTGHPIASTEGLRVLLGGGNAMDAALTAAFVLAVVKSYHCGLGGDLFLLYYSARDRKVFSLNGSGRSPRGLVKDRYRGTIPKVGILAAALPGAVDGWCQAAAKFASRDLKALVEPAIVYAEEGFPVFANLARVVASSASKFASEPGWPEIFLPGGCAPRIGSIFRQKDLARSLKEIAAYGRDGFYRGWIADSLVATSQRRGGFFDHGDLQEQRSCWDEPIHAGYRGREIYVPPPNSYGLFLLLQLKLLERCDLAGLDGHAARLASQLQAQQRAAAEGAGWIADPSSIDLDALRQWLQKYPEDAKATTAPIAQDAGGDTTYIAVADAQGNWASLIQSVHQSFGCGVVVDGTGIVLNDRMPGFNLVPGHANEIAPGKLPAHTLSPALVMKDGEPEMVIGTPGGMGQTQFLAQMICNLFDFGMDVQQAIEAPRWQSEKSGQVDFESRILAEVIDSLPKDRYRAKVVGAWDPAMGGAEAILRDESSGVLLGGADPRRDGYALGF